MAFTKLVGTGKTAGKVDYVSLLDDEPNDVGGLDAAALKAVFDKAGKEIQTYLNDTLTAELESSAGGASIGVSATGITATKLNSALAELKTACDNATVGTLPNGSVSTAIIQDGAVTSAKIPDGAVTTAKLAATAVTAAKLAADAVETAKIKDGNVTGAKIAGGAITNSHLGTNKAVKTANLADDGELIVPVAKGGTGATGAADARTNLGAQKAISGAAVTLDKDDWTEDNVNNVYTQTLNVTGMASSSQFIASPNDADSWDEAGDVDLYPPTPGTGTLTFTAVSEPSKDINVTVYFW